MTDEEFLAPIRADAERRRTGPACALCRHVSLTLEDWPDWSPSSPAPIHDRVRVAQCPEVKARVMGMMGHNCDSFERKPS